MRSIARRKKVRRKKNYREGKRRKAIRPLNRRKMWKCERGH